MTNTSNIASSRVIAYLDESAGGSDDLRFDSEIPFGNLSAFGESIKDKMEIDRKDLHEVLLDNHFVIPPYQRLYSWKHKQLKEFWEVITDFVHMPAEQSGEQVFGLYFGSIYIAEDGSGSRLEIIDGQQRLTTTSIFLFALKQKLEERTDDLYPDLASFVNSTLDQLKDVLYDTGEFTATTTSIRLNKHDTDFYNKFLLQPARRQEYLEDRQEKDRGRYDARFKEAIQVGELINRIGDSSLKSEFEDAEQNEYIYFAESHKRLIHAYNFFDNHLDALLEEIDDQERQVILLINLKNYVLRSFVVSLCSIESEEATLRMNIFESLNDKGLDLAEIDLIRARILNRFAGEADADKYTEIWEDVIKSFGADSREIKRFLTYFIAATDESISKLSDVNKALLDVFRTKEGESGADPRMETADEARELLTEIGTFKQYYLDIKRGELTSAQSDISDIKRECEEILARLDGLRTIQWRPLVTYVYQSVDQSPGGDQLLLKVMRAVENISFRRVFVETPANTVEPLYVKATHEFRRLEGEDEFTASDLENFMVREAREAAPQMFGSGFVTTLVQKTEWGNKNLKNLLWKLSSEMHYEQSGASSISVELNLDSIHLEHVLPVNMLREDAHDPYAWLKSFFKTNDVDTQIANQVAELEQLDAVNLNDDSQAAQRAEDIISGIRDRFVRDLGNVILLREDINKSIQNRLFSRKLYRYLDDDFREIGANEYLTENGDLDRSKLDELQSSEIDFTIDESNEANLSEIEKYFNYYWNYQNSASRKADLIEDTLDSLTFSTQPDEFETAKNDIEDLVKRDMRNRLEDRRLGGLQSQVTD
ncbi:uncharacterized protein with ParB-like and HNH nuclease domain [Natrinema hispanicum]|uniref:Uncharacterized protein with ParB-like and HNH nuclease domain n=1 Tax=Natrinema hispanicum TaxID=392421 RepID=A0A482Y5Y1_9EURY|nr:DUF262 domain-containing protein [Natrinema hispanicum]RZV10503.1 uncharacterized protein with ParB-like and HNH nuclease domain [Natrinema hispanicum]